MNMFPEKPKSNSYSILPQPIDHMNMNVDMPLKPYHMSTPVILNTTEQDLSIMDKYDPHVYMYVTIRYVYTIREHVLYIQLRVMDFN